METYNLFDFRRKLLGFNFKDNPGSISREEMNAALDIFYSVRGLQSEYALLNTLMQNTEDEVFKNGKLQKDNEEVKSNYEVHLKDGNMQFFNNGTEVHLHDVFWLRLFETPRRMLVKQHLWEKFPAFMKKIREKIVRIIKLRFQFGKILLMGPQSDNDFFVIQVVCFRLNPIQVAKAFYMQDTMSFNRDTAINGSETLRFVMAFFGSNFQHKCIRHVFGTELPTDKKLWEEMLKLVLGRKEGGSGYFIKAKNEGLFSEIYAELELLTKLEGKDDLFYDFDEDKFWRKILNIIYTKKRTIIQLVTGTGQEENEETEDTEDGKLFKIVKKMNDFLGRRRNQRAMGLAPVKDEIDKVYLANDFANRLFEDLLPTEIDENLGTGLSNDIKDALKLVSRVHDINIEKR